MKLAALMLCLFAAVAVAETTTQPSTQPATQAARPGPAGQLTSLVTADVMRIANAPEENRPALIEKAEAQLLGLKVYGSVLVDSVETKDGVTVVTGHLPWKQDAVLTAEEQGRIEAAKSDLDAVLLRGKADSDLAVRRNGRDAESTAIMLKNDNKTAAQYTAKLKVVRDRVGVEASAKVPNNTVTFTTKDPAAAKIKIPANYNITGYVSAVAMDEAPPYVVFTIQVLPVPK